MAQFPITHLRLTPRRNLLKGEHVRTTLRDLIIGPHFVHPDFWDHDGSDNVVLQKTFEEEADEIAFDIAGEDFGPIRERIWETNPVSRAEPFTDKPDLHAARGAERDYRGPQYRKHRRWGVHEEAADFRTKLAQERPDELHDLAQEFAGIIPIEQVHFLVTVAEHSFYDLCEAAYRDGCDWDEENFVWEYLNWYDGIGKSRAA